MVEQQSSEQNILILSDESDCSDDDQSSFSVFSSQDKADSKKAIQGALVKVRMNRTIAIKQGQFQQSKEISDIYEFKEKLGEGAFGKVYKAVHRETGIQRAIKLIYKKKVDSPKSILSEIESLMKLDHPNLIKLYEHYETKTKIFLVQELLKGEELYERLRIKEFFDETYGRKLFYQILDAINFIHKHRISHRDIKPENFVFEDPSSDNLKLIDFGLSSPFIPGQELNQSTSKKYISMRSVVGTVWYMAPEIYDHSYTEKCDIWSAGVMLFIMLCGYPPFYGENREEIKKRVLKGKVKFDDPVWDEISEEAKDLISKMLTKEDERLTAEQCLAHPWFTKDKSMLSQVNISSCTLGRIKNFTHVIRLKKAILMFIAYRSNSREEVEKQRRIFLQLDSKKNGYVTYDEISTLLSPHLDDGTIKKIFNSMDTDENGRIYWNEFLAATISQAIFLKEENLLEAFNNFDQARKGYFDIEDLKNSLGDPDLTFNNNEFEMIFREAFPEGKDKITFEDFTVMMEHLAT